MRVRVLAIALSVLLLALGAWIFPRLGSEFTPRLMEGGIIANLTMHRPFLSGKPCATA